MNAIEELKETTLDQKALSETALICIGTGLIEQAGLETGRGPAKLTHNVAQMLWYARKVQEWFLKKNSLSLELRQAFAQEFFSDRMPALSALLQTVYPIEPDGIYEINKSILLHIEGQSGEIDVDNVNDIIEELKQVKDLTPIKTMLIALIRNRKNEESIQKVV